ncbi:winged helix-turn-helix domain-containing protein [Thalassotalea psychrophila]|uniref:Winged helix-turn-helix domain-containing protein n=1 Tax=Thalassotalea psychrophila TaxID=3065647 RepID=A0ABY9TZN5_9GAMM|nr:winged helix-turn-helix domain-containing protein [Colwelliaceae bacterium SQ149]
MIKLTFAKYKIDRFTINCHELTVASDEKSIKLPVKVFELLKLFILNADSFVQRSHAIDVIWEGNEGVGKRGYTNAMWQLRKAFGDLGAENEEVFKTLHKVGYFLVITPKPIASDAEVEAAQQPNASLKPWQKGWMIASVASLLLIVIAGLSYLLYTQEDKYQFADHVALQVTELQGIEEQPAVSYNERYLAFRWQEDENESQLYIQDLFDNHKPIRALTGGQAKKSSPVWSVTGDTVAFLLLTKKGECQVRTKHIFTEKIKILDTGCFYQHQQSGLSWSDDGQFLIYPKVINGEAQLFSLKLVSNKSKKQAKPVSFPKASEQDVMGLYSQDNSQLVFVRIKDNKTSLVKSEVNKKDKILISDLEGILGLDWHYSTNSIYMTIFNNGNYSTQRYGLKDQTLEEIDYIDSSSGLSISQSNNKVYFSRHLDHEFIIQDSLLQDNREVSRVKSIYRNYFGRYVPNTGAVLFVSDRSGEIDLWIKSVKGKKNLTNGIGEVLNSAVSPKSDKFVVSLKADETNEYQLYLGDLPNGILTPLNTGELEPKNPTWNRSGDAIYFSSKTKAGSGIFTMNIYNSTITQVTFENDIYAIEGDDNMLYITKEGEDGIWQFNPETQNSIRIIEGLQQGDFGNFFWENNSIYFIYRDDESDILLNYLGEDTFKITTKFPSDTIHKGFGISTADQQTFLLTRNRVYDANIYSTEIIKQ